ncbi:MAG: hypothetical protein V2A78_09035 [bacterium]
MKLPDREVLRGTVRYAFYIFGLNALLIYAVVHLSRIEPTIFAVGLGLGIPFLVQGVVFFMPALAPMRPWPILLVSLVLLVLFFFCRNFWMASLLYAAVRLLLVGLVGRILPREVMEKKIRHFMNLWGGVVALAASSLLLMSAPPVLPGTCFFCFLFVFILSLGVRLKPRENPGRRSASGGARLPWSSLWRIGAILFLILQTAGVALLNLECFAGGSGGLERIQAGGLCLGFFLLGVNLGKVSWHPISLRLRGGFPYKISLFAPGFMLLLLGEISSLELFVPFLVIAGAFLGLQETAFFAVLKVLEKEKFSSVYSACQMVVTWVLFFALVIFGLLQDCYPGQRELLFPAVAGIMILSATGEFIRCRMLEKSYQTLNS